ncbi:hypothetical protein Q5P01_011647 [Channa striata]|uniref:Uncharacterized protein n=1 Tax=Channa striata TaxID=64152 RepID=A0AA88MWQ0_CHASR|nr:hypothetical protein Q5P01_011647 [Channa striata]
MKCFQVTESVAFSDRRKRTTGTDGSQQKTEIRLPTSPSVRHMDQYKLSSYRGGETNRFPELCNHEPAAPEDLTSKPANNQFASRLSSSWLTEVRNSSDPIYGFR